MNKTALVLAGFPCTQFSIAQKKNRIASVDFTAEEFNAWRASTPKWWLRISDFEKQTGDKLGIDGYKFEMGLQLFFNCLVAVEKLQLQGYTVHYLFENVASMNKEVKQTLFDIVGDYHIEINSALVSAQNRKRIYFTNFEVKGQPEDRGLLLRDVLEDGTSWIDKSYTLDSNYFKTSGVSFGSQAGRRKMVAERLVNINPSGHGMNGTVISASGKSRCLTTNKGEGQKIIEPVLIGEIKSNGTYRNGNQPSQQYRVYSSCGKSVCLNAGGGGGGAKTGLYACPVGIGYRGRMGNDGKNHKIFESNGMQKANALTTTQTDSMVAYPVCTQISKIVPIEFDGDKPTKAFCNADSKTYTVYEVKGGLITIKDKQYAIKLPDGFYIIRKLTVTECCRLQTLPDDYCKAVSKSQGYKCLGNGWTADVIKYIMQYADIPTDEPLTVVSLYDGISTGRYVLDQMGYKNITYYAYEIDKYAKQVSSDNWDDVIQCGDALQVRHDNWMQDKQAVVVIDDDKILEALEQLSIAI